MWCFKNAEQVEALDLQDRAFHYGDGCFTTARIYQGKFELKARHLLRLKNSCEYLFLKADLSLIEKSLAKLQSQLDVFNGTLKIIISRGVGQRGYSLPEQHADVYVWFYPQTHTEFAPQFIQTGVLNQVIGMSMPHLVGIKTLNRLEQVLLKQEADQQQWIEALVTDVQGMIVEGVSSNCFIYLKDTWITPELRYNGVHGVMRAEILSRMEKLNVPVAHGFIDMDEIANIQALFFCNALSPMKAVTHLDGKPLDAQICVDLFHTLQLNQIH
ncbi:MULTISPECIES: aminodeoxychorismate lyase [Acinetobacter]|uniref:Aminodeoxychorismate lyase n=1 Tax=Acinetobacter ursingii TaxID=108980 RepID=A0A7T9Z5Q4_9GAMM|nr:MULTISPECIES: aminodeoxychorismate lyase [Acinetobacter]ENX48171.1 aminodeoxychorismate lyase [Acinetobacter ursingii NIPH 706]EXD36479.1 aminodeoxychorismate lyase [Acinetobacter sp. 479375]MCH2015793.1 aminodeoxychorismate lyase [Acinetobacter ursingii]MCU4524121.1 aminodeoxychorismate lyase [Acinetobacter ursingii]QQT85330.1 aminodeoxychorismate lyase [Acinetobacter ursingii]